MRKQDKPLEKTEQTKIYVCGYCDEVLPEKKIVKHLEKIHNVTRCEVSNVITKVVML